MAAMFGLRFRGRFAWPALFAAGAFGTLAAGAGSVCPDGRCAVGMLDTALLTHAQAIVGPLQIPFWRAITWLGSLYVLVPLAVMVTLVPARASIAQRAFLITALLSTAALAQAFKWMIDRPRPELFPPLADVPPDPSYPSGHAMQATAFALALLMMPGLRRRALAALVLLPLLALVAASRVLLQVHFPTDVVFGVLAALCWVAALRMLLRFVEDRE